MSGELDNNGSVSQPSWTPLLVKIVGILASVRFVKTLLARRRLQSQIARSVKAKSVDTMKADVSREYAKLTPQAKELAAYLHRGHLSAASGIRDAEDARRH